MSRKSPVVQWRADIPIHTEAFRDLAATEAGHRALLDSAKALAMTAVDVLTDAGLRQRMKREFEAESGPRATPRRGFPRPGWSGHIWAARGTQSSPWTP
jgi:hypothetical protein